MGNKLGTYWPTETGVSSMCSRLTLGHIGKIFQNFKKQFTYHHPLLTLQNFLDISQDIFTGTGLMPLEVFNLFLFTSGKESQLQVSAIELFCTLYMLCDSNTISFDKKLDGVMGLCQFRNLPEPFNAANLCPPDNPLPVCTLVQVLLMFESTMSGLCKVGRCSPIASEQIMRLVVADIFIAADLPALHISDMSLMPMVSAKLASAEELSWPDVKLRIMKQVEVVSFLSVYADIVCLDTVQRSLNVVLIGVEREFHDSKREKNNRSGGILCEDGGDMRGYQTVDNLHTSSDIPIDTVDGCCSFPQDCPVDHLSALSLTPTREDMHMLPVVAASQARRGSHMAPSRKSPVSNSRRPSTSSSVKEGVPLPPSDILVIPVKKKDKKGKKKDKKEKGLKNPLAPEEIRSSTSAATPMQRRKLSRIRVTRGGKGMKGDSVKKGVELQTIAEKEMLEVVVPADTISNGSPLTVLVAHESDGIGISDNCIMTHSSSHSSSESSLSTHPSPVPLTPDKPRVTETAADATWVFKPRHVPTSTKPPVSVTITEVINTPLDCAGLLALIQSVPGCSTPYLMPWEVALMEQMIPTISVDGKVPCGEIIAFCTALASFNVLSGSVACLPLAHLECLYRLTFGDKQSLPHPVILQHVGKILTIIPETLPEAFRDKISFRDVVHHGSNNDEDGLVDTQPMPIATQSKPKIWRTSWLHYFCNTRVVGSVNPILNSAFNQCDTDGQGSIFRTDVLPFLRLSLKPSILSISNGLTEGFKEFVDENLEQLRQWFIELMDPDNTGEILWEDVHRNRNDIVKYILSVENYILQLQAADALS